MQAINYLGDSLSYRLHAKIPESEVLYERNPTSWSYGNKYRWHMHIQRGLATTGVPRYDLTVSQVDRIGKDIFVLLRFNSDRPHGHAARSGKICSDRVRVYIPFLRVQMKVHYYVMGRLSELSIDKKFTYVASKEEFIQAIYKWKYVAGN